VWSPNGRHLVYAFRGGRPAAGLGIIEMNRVERRILARTGPKDLYLRPEFSPDGERLVAQRRSREGSGSRIWVLKRGEIPSPLFDDSEAVDIKPHFDRSGTHIVFTRRMSISGPGEIAVVGEGGQDVQILYEDAEADDHSARPSPVRDEIAFISNRAGRPQLYVGNLAGTGLTHIPLEGRSVFAPRWSPDGERLVLSTARERENLPKRADASAVSEVELVVIDRNGNVLLETPGLMADWMPAWP
jgi:Tol biopolymer transport system component